MPAFLIDLATGRKVLSTRKRCGEGCHGRAALFWKAHGGGVEVLCCKVCGKTHGKQKKGRCGPARDRTGCAAGARELAAVENSERRGEK